MNIISHLPTAPAAGPHHLILAVTPAHQRAPVAELIAALVMQGPFSIVAGNERRLPAYQVVRLLHLCEKTTVIKQQLDQGHLVRASTCFQLLDLLQNTPPTPQPLLVLDFLHTFYDQDLAMQVRMRILHGSVRELERLALSRPIAVLTQYMDGSDYASYYPLLERIADNVLRMEDEQEAGTQLGLF